ncbi:hypothetical protein BaRGS_00011865 [Batillaria attramentaria]|uniref:Uncharacterized protein n=1 Tax=Batillaria attramentaria TaxID=370345 RepID=A0ABD0LC72_9CAEN
MTGREIVTLQLGHYANFTGSHWWNAQEAAFVYDPKVLQAFPKEINHDLLFREGQTQKGQVTFTPRLVALDLRGSLNTLRKEGTLYGEASEEEVKWSGDVTLHQSAAGPKNEFLDDIEKAEEAEDVEWKRHRGQAGDEVRDGDEVEDASKTDKAMEVAEEAVFGQKFYQLDDQVRVWSDYLSVHLHPRSVQILQDYSLASEDEPFNVFGVGQQALCGEVWDDLEDRLRFFTEECDLLQGFHILFDAHNSFGGATARVLHYLKDEFPGKAVLALPVSPAILPDQTAKHRATRIINSALCVGMCASQSSLYVPLCLATSLWRNLGVPRDFPLLSYNPELNYHTSAILSAALDTMTFPYRQETNPLHLWDITTSFSSIGRKVAALSSSLPMPLLETGTFMDMLMSPHEAGALWHSLTPSVTRQAHPSFHSCVVRGVPPNKVKRDRAASSPRLSSRCDTVQDILQLYLAETYPQSMNAGSVMRDPIDVSSPFPHIFQPQVTRAGLVSSTLRHPKCGVKSVPMMTSLQSSSDVGHYVSSLHAEASRFTIRRHHHFLEAGLEEEEFVETLDTLHQLADCYM